MTVGEETEKRGYSNAEEALRSFENDRIEALFPNYDAVQTVFVAIDFRGLPITASLVNGALVFKVPSLDIGEKFYGEGATSAEQRDSAIDKFVEFLESEGGDILDRIQRELARVSPVDPVAGNPNSLQSNLVQDAFDSGAFATGQASTENRTGLAVSGGVFQSGDFEGRSVTIPLSRDFHFDSRPGMKLEVKLPITLVETEDAQIYSISPSLALTAPVNDRWSLTPGLSWGVSGSIDAASVAQMAGATLTSKYRVPDLPTEGASMTVGNMVGYVQTLPFAYQDFSFDPGIRNTVLKNGLMIEQPVGAELYGEEMTAQLSYAHSRFFGTDLYMNGYHEVAVSLGTPVEGIETITDELRLGVAYTFGNDYQSVTFNLGYRF